MVNTKHIAFARAIVALAREHGMNHLNITFDAASSAGYSNGDYCWEKVKMTWHEGRHGNFNAIKLETSATLTIEEA